MDKQYFVYILAKDRNGTLYIGFTANLAKRVREHKDELAEGFTKKYGTKTLVYYEAGGDYEGMLYREKQLKKWRRDSKVKLIETRNGGIYTTTSASSPTPPCGGVVRLEGTGVETA